MKGPLETVKAALAAFVDNDRDTMEKLIGEPYSFSSPLDNALDRKTYFERCWPNSGMITNLELVHGAENGDHAWIVYIGHTKDKRFQNAELHRVVDGRMMETQVYFGWDLPHKAPRGGSISNA